MNPAAAARTQAQVARAGKSTPLWLALLYLLVAVLVLVPFLLMMLLAFKQADMAPSDPLEWIPRPPTLENFRKLFAISLFWRWLWNSVVTTVLPVGLSMLLSSLLGFLFAKKRFPGRELIFWSFMATMMIPSQVRLIPNFILYQKFGWINTYWVFIVPGAWTVSSLFLMRQYMKTIPDALLEAAHIDGASDWRCFWEIILPMSRPALATLATFGFITHWNDLMTPLIFASKESMRTLTLAFAAFISQGGNLGLQMAAALINFIPTFLIFLAARRQFVEGITLGSVKG